MTAAERALVLDVAQPQKHTRLGPAPLEAQAPSSRRARVRAFKLTTLALSSLRLAFEAWFSTGRSDRLQRFTPRIPV